MPRMAGIRPRLKCRIWKMREIPLPYSCMTIFSEPMDFPNPEKAGKMDREALSKVAEVFRAFGEVTRLQILQELKAGPRHVNGLVEALGLSQANVSKQLRVLLDAGLVGRERRGNQVVYELSDGLAMEMCRVVCDKLNREALIRPAHFAI